MSHARHRHGLRAIAVCFLVVLGLTVGTTDGAQAKGDWYVKGVKSTGTIGVTAKENGNDLILLSSYGATNTPIEILCSKLVTDEGLLSAGGGSLAELLISTCKVFLEKSKTPSTKCVVNEPISIGAKGLLVKDPKTESGTYMQIEPATGSEFTVLGLGPACAAGEEWPISGAFVVKETSSEFELEKVTHSLEEASASTFGVSGLLVGKHQITLAGSIETFLTAPNAGAAWSATTGEFPPPPKVGDWKVAGVATKSTTGVTVGSLDTDLTLISAFGAVNTPIKILCEELKVSDGLLITGGTSSAWLSFSECDAFLENSKIASTKCVPEEPIALKVKGALVEHEGESYSIIQPFIGNAFVTIGLGASCAAGEEIEITGSTALRDSSLELDSEKVSHLIEEAPAALFGGSILFGKHAMTVSGGAILKLTAPNEGVKWSGIPL